VADLDRFEAYADSLLPALVDNLPGAIYRCAIDEHWTMRLIGPEIERISGYPPEDFVDSARRTFNSIIHPRDRRAVHVGVREAIRRGRPYEVEYRIVRVDGGVRWVHDRGAKTIDRAGCEWTDGFIFDITEHRRREELLREREAEAARVAELEASRNRIIAAADDARRRIERDLHDGAQQRLVIALLHLQAAERAGGSNGTGIDGRTAEHLRLARTELDAGLHELRELARGIHPAVLTDHGLSHAVAALAARSAVPVEVDDRLRSRLSAPVEAALYYTVAEALTNVERYAAASHATVVLRDDSSGVEVEIRDDGCGGARMSAGTGLRGLEDRLCAVDGSVAVESPPGAGTCVRARVPRPTAERRRSRSARPRREPTRNRV
jgi:PAS domain S-box-containing protein